MEEKDYSMGKIYMVWSPNTDKVYIGSTIQTLKKRFDGHKSDNLTSQIIIGCGLAEIKLIHYFPCGSSFELGTEEGREMRLHPNRVNIQLPNRTKQELKELADKKNKRRRNISQEKRDKINEGRRNISQEKRDKMNENQRNISQETRDKNNERQNKANAKKSANMSQEERDKMNEIRRNLREEHKDIRNERERNKPQEHKDKLQEQQNIRRRKKAEEKKKAKQSI
jgi:hypothetical protein